jgi:hypothetical protein
MPRSNQYKVGQKLASMRVRPVQPGMSMRVLHGLAKFIVVCGLRG